MSSIEIEEEDTGEGEEQSTCQKFCGSIVVALCCAPLLFIGSMFLLGWNEKYAVCQDRAINSAARATKTLTCTDAPKTHDGELVFLSCPVNPDSYMLASKLASSPWSTPLESQASGVKDTKTLGLRIEVEKLYCAEIRHEHTRTVTSGKKKKTVRYYTYSYEKKWMSSKPGSYQNPNEDGSMPGNIATGCDVPSTYRPDADTPPEAGQMEKRVPQMKVGMLTTDPKVINLVPITTQIKFKDGTTQGGFRVRQGSGYFQKVGKTGTTGTTCSGDKGYNCVGAQRVKMYGSALSNDFTISGKNSGGTIVDWVAPKTWLCDELDWQENRLGKMTDAKELFAAMTGENGFRTWALRLVGFCLMWFALTRFFGPLEVFAEFIPCIGEYVSDFLEAIICICSCPPACACCLCVASIVWVVMRPMVGIPMMICACCCAGGAIAAKFYVKNQKEGQDLEAQS